MSYCTADGGFLDLIDDWGSGLQQISAQLFMEGLFTDLADMLQDLGWDPDTHIPSGYVQGYAGALGPPGMAIEYGDPDASLISVQVGFDVPDSDGSSPHDQAFIAGPFTDRVEQVGAKIAAELPSHLEGILRGGHAITVARGAGGRFVSRR